MRPLEAASSERRAYTRNAMGLFDPNRFPEPYPMLTSWKRVAIGALVLVVVVVGLFLVLPALAD